MFSGAGTFRSHPHPLARAVEAAMPAISKSFGFVISQDQTRKDMRSILLF